MKKLIFSYLAIASMLCLSVVVARARTPQSSQPTDLGRYSYRTLTNASVELYMNQWGAGYLHDKNKNVWVSIPQTPAISIQPAYCKTSNTMALIYGGRGLMVYDSSLYSATSLGHAWAMNTTNQGVPFYSFSRSATANYAAQLNDNMALGAGTSWIAVYSRSLHRWINYPAGADDSTASLNQYMVLTMGYARVKILNGPFCNFAFGTAGWQCQ